MMKEGEIHNRVMKKKAKAAADRTVKAVSCPYCGSKKGSRVVSTYSSRELRTVRRMRVCNRCRRRFTTNESFPPR